jgi:UPF0755 protein
MRYRVALVAACLAALGLAWFAYRASAPPGLEHGPIVVEVPAHVGVLEIGHRLESSGVLRSRIVFVALSVVRGTARRLKAGEYEVPPRATALDVLQLLESGRVRQHAVLHPEGATVEELARVLADERLATAAEVLRVARDPAFLRDQGIDAPSVEGYLFPDTYQFVRGMKPEEILGRMVQRLRAKLPPDTEARARARGVTVHQLLTLASIVEREAVVADERRIISGVFWNRLQRDMPLQADPTVQYAMGKGRRALTRADLETDHPFNTYRRSGLPPGPIASAGLPAIEAALDPAAVPYLYFVKLDERRHHFSTTMAEHNAAVTRYRLARTR